MKLQSRLPELVLLAIAVPLLAVLLYPLRRAPLPATQNRPAPAAVPEQAAAQSTPDPLPSIRDAAALFVAYHGPAVQARKLSAPPEKVSWLHFVAYVVASNEKKVYFFKNDQTGRVLMLTYNQPHEGWNLTRIETGTYVLEKENHSYMVSEK